MTRIRVREGEPIEEAIRRFRRVCERDGIRRELRRREHYTPPSVMKKIKRREAARRRRRHARKRSRAWRV